MAMQSNRTFWPNDARPCVTLPMQFEAGGQPISGAAGLIPDPMAPGLPTNSFFDSGIREGIPRLSNRFDMHGIKATSLMVGETATQIHRGK